MARNPGFAGTTDTGVEIPDHHNDWASAFIAVAQMAGPVFIGATKTDILDKVNTFYNGNGVTADGPDQMVGLAYNDNKIYYNAGSATSIDLQPIINVNTTDLANDLAPYFIDQDPTDGSLDEDIIADGQTIDVSNGTLIIPTY